MKIVRKHSKSSIRIAVLLIVTSVAACGDGGREPILDFSGGVATAPVLDTTRPRVTVTQPATTTPGPTPAVPANTAVSAVFTEELFPATIIASSFTLTCTGCVAQPTGVVSYAAGTRTATYRPDAVLEVGAVYTATITTAATDLAGNALAGNQAPLPAASNYIWSFTTVDAVAATPITLASTNPANTETGVCPTAGINATFTTAGFRLDPASVNATTFTLVETVALTAIVAESIVLDDASGRTITFTPLNDLVNGTNYTATIKGGPAGIQDEAVPANKLVADVTWSFTAGPALATCLVPVDLATASTFGTSGGSAGMTNQGVFTVINGDISTTAPSASVTGFHSPGAGCIYTETGSNVGTVNGNIYTAPAPPTIACPQEGTAETLAIAQQARMDALTAYNELAGLAGLAGPANLAGVTLFSGVYSAPGGTFRIQGGDLTLDAQGDANAVWVFQMATTLTVGGPGAAFPQSVLLINGAQAKNVFWQVGSAATINAAGGGTMIGTIISQAGAAFSTAGNVDLVTLNGRVLSLNASVTLVNTVINVPAP